MSVLLDQAGFLPADPEPDPGELQLGEARLVDWTAEQYLAAREYVSRSGLEELRARPERYFGKYVDGSIPQDPPSAQMIMGTYVHLCTLEPTEWARRLYVPEPERPPEADGKARKDTPEKLAYVRWKAQCIGWQAGIRPDSIILTPRERTVIETIAARVRAHEYGSALVESPGLVEQTVLWRHPVTGMSLRVRLDKLTHIDDDLKVVLDLKTTNDASPRMFGSSVAKFGYHRQGALYIDAVRALYPNAEVDYALGVVTTSPPYEVAFYQLEEHELELGRVQTEAAMRELIRRREENDWIAPWQRGLQSLTLPGWAYHEET
jgi:hypothetical protein